MRKLLLLVMAFLFVGGCPRGGAARPTPEPVAEPAPVEIQWPDAGPDGG